MAVAFDGFVDITTFKMVVPMCTAIGTVVGSLFATIFNVGGFCTVVAHKLGAKPGTPGEVLIRNMAVITIMLLIMNFAITAITHYYFGAPFSGAKAMMGASVLRPPTDLDLLLNAWFRPIPFLWGPCYVVSIIVDPICMWLSFKMFGISTK